MWSKTKIAHTAAYLLLFSVLSFLFSIFSLQTPEKRSGPFALVCALSAAIYPICLVCTRSKTGFWRGLFIFLLILTATQAVGFIVYLLMTSEIKYGPGEDAAWFIALELIPSYIVAIICFPLAYWATRLVRWMAAD
jgi:hypothetical protein